MIVIPTRNRVNELAKVLQLYSQENFNGIEFVILDGSDSDQILINKETIIKFSSSLDIKHVIDGSDLHPRLLNYIERLSDLDVLILANDEDFFEKEYVVNSLKFMRDNLDYCGYIGKYVTWQKKVIGLNRVSSWREVICEGDISFDNPGARLSLLHKFFIAGCSPVIWSARRVGQLRASLRLQNRTYMHTTRELIDQVHLALYGKIKFINANMLWRDERRLDFKSYPQRADLVNNIPPESIPEVQEILENEFNGLFNKEINYYLDWYKAANPASLSFNTIYFSSRYSKKNFFSPNSRLSKIFHLLDKAMIIFSEIFYALAIIRHKKKSGKATFIRKFLEAQ